jgi:sugar/nucleoside kinase (ribokinase family)
MEKQIENGKKLVVCTHGKGGATTYNNKGEWIETPIIDVYIMKNANGAGDAFFSGFLYGFSKGFETKKCMQFGAITSGLCIESELIANKNLSSALIEKEYEIYFSNKL